MDYLELLHDRFKNLNELRITTVRHHITMLGGVLAFLAFAGGRSEGYVRAFMPYIVLASSFFLLILGYCVMAYDSRIRQRTSFVAREIEDVVVTLGLVASNRRNQHKTLSEDYWFFSQMIAANALTVVVFVDALAAVVLRRVPSAQVSLADPLVVSGNLVLFVLAWLLLTNLWSRAGNNYRKRVSNWTPS